MYTCEILDYSFVFIIQYKSQRPCELILYLTPFTDVWLLNNRYNVIAVQESNTSFIKHVHNNIHTLITFALVAILSIYIYILHFLVNIDNPIEGPAITSDWETPNVSLTTNIFTLRKIHIKYSTYSTVYPLLEISNYSLWWAWMFSILSSESLIMF